MSTGHPCEFEQLETLFAGQLDADPDGICVFPDGSEAADPLAWAAQARRALGSRVRIYGFWCFENPGASAMGELRERHDFAIVDRRWLVDLWLRRFHSGAGVVDIEDKDSYAAVMALYGDPNTWERDLDMEHRMDSQALLGKAAIPAGLLGMEGIEADF